MAGTFTRVAPAASSSHATMNQTDVRRTEPPPGITLSRPSAAVGVAATMGQYLDKLAGSPVVDVQPPRLPRLPQPPPPQALPPTPPARPLRIDGVECVICQETPTEHHICCVNGHGGCAGCIHREKLRTATCPLCRLPMLDRMIPNLTLNEALFRTTCSLEQGGPPRPASPARKRPRDPEAEAESRRRRAKQVALQAAALSADLLA